ncbi:hypothetical protein J2Y63_002914 [Shinella sp. BE166]
MAPHRGAGRESNFSVFLVQDVLRAHLQIFSESWIWLCVEVPRNLVMFKNTKIRVKGGNFIRLALLKQRDPSVPQHHCCRRRRPPYVPGPVASSYQKLEPVPLQPFERSVQARKPYRPRRVRNRSFSDGCRNHCPKSILRRFGRPFIFEHHLWTRGPPRLPYGAPRQHQPKSIALAPLKCTLSFIPRQ